MLITFFFLVAVSFAKPHPRSLVTPKITPMPGQGLSLGLFRARPSGCSYFASTTVLASINAQGQVWTAQDMGSVVSNPDGVAVAIALLDALNGTGVYAVAAGDDGVLSFSFAKDCASEFLLQVSLTQSLSVKFLAVVDR
jgi:hypothetical protein